ncbi:MAG TPA: hypothetical protein VLF17_07365 [Candidatus Nitrosotenuis sp.]|nr:hypothetical protein [Candidatus Nitrosotenuis sp.]
MKSKSNSKETFDFMMMEYKLIHDLIMEENSISERRVNLFLSISSISIGGVIVLGQTTQIPSETIYLAAQGVLITLLLFGLTIFNRVNARVVQLNIYEKMLSEIQSYFSEQDLLVGQYIKHRRELVQRKKSKHAAINTFTRLLSRMRGSLTEFMLLSNSLLIGGIGMTASLQLHLPLTSGILVTTITVVVAFLLLSAFYFSIRPYLSPWVG